MLFGSFEYSEGSSAWTEKVEERQEEESEYKVSAAQIIVTILLSHHVSGIE